MAYLIKLILIAAIAAFAAADSRKCKKNMTIPSIDFLTSRVRFITVCAGHGDDSCGPGYVCSKYLTKPGYVCAERYIFLGWKIEWEIVNIAWK